MYAIVDTANAIDINITRPGVGVINDQTYTDSVGSYDFNATQVAAYNEPATEDTLEFNGYKVLFEDSVSGRLIIWTVDASGAYVSQEEITGDAAAIRDAEILFQVQLDDVGGDFGAEPTDPTPTISDIDINAADVDLISEDGVYAIVDTANAIDINITRPGVGVINDQTYTDSVGSYDFNATQVAAYNEPATEDTLEFNGYKVLFEDSVSGRLIIWTVDASGAYVSQEEITNDAAAIRDAEILFPVQLDDVGGDFGAEPTDPTPTISDIDINAADVDLISEDGVYAIVDTANAIDINITRPGVASLMIRPTLIPSVHMTSTRPKSPLIMNQQLRILLSSTATKFSLRIQ